MLESFINQWQQAVMTSVGFFWMAFWAFGLGYLISSLIQVLVTQARMQRVMGKEGPRSMALASFFGFISSSCSFAALATTRTLFQKGAGLAPALAFLLASTNLVIELGIVIAIFLGWQFVVGEYIGGILLILVVWLLVRITKPTRLIQQARERLQANEHDDHQLSSDWKAKLRTWSGWQEIAQTYVMEWQMVWKDVTIGFAVAGVIAAFVPHTFFEFLFVGSGEPGGNTQFINLVWQTLIGPLAAFCTFIGSMGNIPLAALLFSQGVSFAGVMAFIFSDLVVLPVLRINARYYGWKIALYILVLLLLGLVIVSLVLHYGLAAFELLPQSGANQSPGQRGFFKLDYGLVLNVIFFSMTVVFVWLWKNGKKDGEHHHHDHHHHEHGSKDSSLPTRLLQTAVSLAIVWLVGGVLLMMLV